MIEIPIDPFEQLYRESRLLQPDEARVAASLRMAARSARGPLSARRASALVVCALVAVLVAAPVGRAAVGTIASALSRASGGGPLPGSIVTTVPSSNQFLTEASTTVRELARDGDNVLYSLRPTGETEIGGTPEDHSNDVCISGIGPAWTVDTGHGNALSPTRECLPVGPTADKIDAVGLFYLRQQTGTVHPPGESGTETMNPEVLYGFARPDVASVEVRYASGVTRTVPVTGEAWIAVAADPQQIARVLVARNAEGDVVATVDVTNGGDSRSAGSTSSP
jgi:hypothetical protein